MSDQFTFSFAPATKRIRSKPWGKTGLDPEKRRKRQAEQRRKHREKRRAYQRQWRARNPEKVRASLARQYRRKDKDKHRATGRKTLLKKYGLTQKEFLALLEAQDHCCAICRRSFESSPRVDHHHGSKQVRGLLCHPCNSAIGLLGEDPDRLRAATEYIEQQIMSVAFAEVRDE